MKRLAVVVAVAATLALLICELGDLTQSRPDDVRHEAATEIVLTVDEDRFAPGQDATRPRCGGVASTTH